MAKVVFVHGYSDHVGRYYGFFPHLASSGIQVFGWDQRGWGRSVHKPSDRGETGPTSRVVADIAAFIEDKLAAAPVGAPLFVMGHSMGGAGAIYLGVKHPSIWAGVGAIAPAHAPAGIFPQNYSLAPAKGIPMIIVQGDKDPLVPVEGVRQWIDQMKELHITHQYIERAGGDHGTVLTDVPAVIAFFSQHSKK